MNAENRFENEPQPQAAIAPSDESYDRIALARVACASLGATLVVWALSGPVVARLVTGEPPSLRVFQQGFFALLFGAGFLWLQARFRDWPWAISTCNAIAGLIMFVTFLAASVGGISTVASALLIFAPFATLATWMARPSVERPQLDLTPAVPAPTPEPAASAAPPADAAPGLPALRRAPRDDS